MKPNPSLDELLCSFMDGELSPRQWTEVQRMAARDPEVARRLRQLQNCRTLFCSLPQVEAPADLLDQVRLSLERRTLLREEPAFVRRSAGAWHLTFRRLVTAAAMITLLGVLGAVVYQIMAPIPGTGPGPLASQGWPGPEIEPDRTAVGPAVIADAGFSGRLELRTATPVQVDAVIKRAIAASGLSDLVKYEAAGDGRVYRLVSTREGVNRLITALSSIWQKLDSSELQVDRFPDSAGPVVVAAVTPEQAVSIIARTSTESSVEAAEAYAVMNNLSQAMPGCEISALIDDGMPGPTEIATIPRPIETSNVDTPKTTLAPPQGDPEADLTIVLLGTSR